MWPCKLRLEGSAQAVAGYLNHARWLGHHVTCWGYLRYIAHAWLLHVHGEQTIAWITSLVPLRMSLRNHEIAWPCGHTMTGLRIIYSIHIQGKAHTEELSKIQTVLVKIDTKTWGRGGEAWEVGRRRASDVPPVSIRLDHLKFANAKTGALWSSIISLQHRGIKKYIASLWPKRRIETESCLRQCDHQIDKLRNNWVSASYPFQMTGSCEASWFHWPCLANCAASPSRSRNMAGNISTPKYFPVCYSDHLPCYLLSPICPVLPLYCSTHIVPTSANSRAVHICENQFPSHET